MIRMAGSLSTVPPLNGGLVSIPTLSSKLSIPEGYFPEEYEGAYEMNPSALKDQVLETEGKFLTKNVSVLKIQKFTVSNSSGGYTVTIA